MIIIPIKIIQYKDEDGNMIDQIQPVKELPQGVRIHFDGTNYLIAEDSRDEDDIINSSASLKEIVDEQKAIKDPPKDP